jgi:hypothetical protein
MEKYDRTKTVARSDIDEGTALCRDFLRGLDPETAFSFYGSFTLMSLNDDAGTVEIGTFARLGWLVAYLSLIGEMAEELKERSQ